MSTTDLSQRELIIEAGGSPRQYAREVWRYRELLFILSWRDIKVRFKQTTLGAAWALLRPLLTLIILTVVFSKIARLPSEGNAPYALLVLSGLMPWQFFAAGLSDAANSVIENEKIVSKIYFPRFVIPVSALAVCVVDFAISLLILAGIFAYYRFVPDWHLLALPLVLVFAIFAALGPGIDAGSPERQISGLPLRCPFSGPGGHLCFTGRVQHQPGSRGLALLYYLNPMAGLIDAFRWTVLGGEFTPWWPGVGLSLCVLLALLIVGMLYFRATERSFADNI